METLTEEEQLITVEKVLQEMQYAEKFVSEWKASWYEKLSRAYWDNDKYPLDSLDIHEIEKKYHPHYRLINPDFEHKPIGIPLVKEIIKYHDLEFICDFAEVNWTNLKSSTANRSFTFKNNGDIALYKTSNKTPSTKKPRCISYSASYNVLSNNFTIDFDIAYLDEDNFKTTHNITLTLSDNIAILKHDDIEITQYLDTGMKSIKIIKGNNTKKKNSHTSVVFEALLNPDDSLEVGAIAINTRKANGKVNGTYRFDVSRKKGIRANFYSRKGKKIDLISNPLLLEKVNPYLLPQKDAPSEVIVSDFANSTQNVLTKNNHNKCISFDNSDFNLASIKRAEDNIIELLKCIKGEIPLKGLVDRIDNYIKLANIKMEVLPSNPKTLELEVK